MRAVYRQRGTGVRFDWGLVGAHALVEDGGCLVVIDVLSFTTAVTVAVSRGMAVLPYQRKDASAVSFAAQHDAVLAVGRSEVTVSAPWSLSPAALIEAPVVPRLVLPSPSGSTIAASSSGLVIAASLRNASAVGQRLTAAGFGTQQRPISVIASGERWSSDDSLRPAVEDLWGAGAVILALGEGGYSLSPEANAAAAAYRSVGDMRSALRESSSGRELIEDGFGIDVDVAAAVDVDNVVPTLVGVTFVDGLL
jgi:2-phosphosulfolactate phosphatase